MVTSNDDGPLAAVADYASRQNTDPDTALTALLDTVQRVIGYQTVLVSEINTGSVQLRVHAVKNTDDALSVPQGLQIPLTASPCQHVAGSVSPFVSADMHADPGLAGLPAAKDMGATAYIGVPVILGDGSFFGTLVGLDLAPKETTDEHVQWLKVLAQLAALQIQRQDARQLA
jgi:GAF domain-containing protein